MSVGLSCLLIGTAAANTIYRTVDSNGRVSFSDQPPAPGTNNTAQIEIRGGNSYSNPIPRAAYEPGLAADATTSGEQFYSSLVITYPEDGATLRNNGGQVAIGTRVGPGLRRGDRVVVVLDGQVVQAEPDDTEFVLNSVSRGTHRVSLAILNAAGEQQIASRDQVFHLQRFAPALAPPPASAPPR